MARREYRPWDDEETSAVLILVELHGTKAFAKYAATSGRSEESVRMHLQKAHRAAWDAAMMKWRMSGASLHGLDRPVLSDDKVAAWWDGFAPVTISAPPKRSVASADTSVTLVASDLHFPLDDPRCIGIFLEAVKKMRPARVILDGDLPDLLALSRYPKDVRHNWGLRAEAEGFAKFLHALESVLPKDASVIEIDANHSGEGTESRWWRYLSERIPELMQHPKAAELMTYRNWWHPAWSRITMAPDLVVADELLVTHGTMARKSGGYTAKAHSEAYISSVMHGHTHRQGSHVRRVPAVGSRGEGVIRAYEIGCLCSLKPTYCTTPPDWTNGFAVITEGGPKRFAVELVTITEGEAVVGALGETLKAA